MIETTLFFTTLIAAPIADAAFIERVERAWPIGAIDVLTECRDKLKNDRAPAVEARDLYALAYVDWRLAHAIEADESKGALHTELLQEAARELETLIKGAPKNAEGRALLATILGEQIGDSWLLGMKLGPRAGELLDEARRLAPKNPRVVMLAGVAAIFKPSMFGGGLDQAEAALTEARALFESEPAGGEWPSWGRLDVDLWLEHVAEKRQRDER